MCINITSYSEKEVHFFEFVYTLVYPRLAKYSFAVGTRRSSENRIKERPSGSEGPKKSFL